LIGFADSAFEPPDLGLDDPSVDLSDSFGSIGAATFRWLNLDSVPLFVWAVLFGISWWLISLGLWEWFDRLRYEPTLVASLLLASRNVVIAVGLTKVISNPMRTWFERGSAFSTEDLMGQLCEIQTGEATPEFGRAKYKTDGSPLLLNVRTSGETLVKGQTAVIIDFEPTKRIYIVQSAEAPQ
jgi:hypothetical protein